VYFQFTYKLIVISVYIENNCYFSLHINKLVFQFI